VANEDGAEIISEDGNNNGCNTGRRYNRGRNYRRNNNGNKHNNNNYGRNNGRNNYGFMNQSHEFEAQTPEIGVKTTAYEPNYMKEYIDGRIAYVFNCLFVCVLGLIVFAVTVNK